MGMIAEYLMIDEETLNSLMDLEEEYLSEKLFEIEESEKFELMDIDKIWDALHCFLTGVSASNPIEDNKLSEAIVGIHLFSEDEDADFISCIDNEELEEIISELEKVDFEKLKQTFDPKEFQKNKIYPEGIWKTDKQELMKEMELAFKDILEFYKKAKETNHHIIVSILYLRLS